MSTIVDYFSLEQLFKAVQFNPESFAPPVTVLPVAIWLVLDNLQQLMDCQSNVSGHLSPCLLHPEPAELLVTGQWGENDLTPDIPPW